MCFYSLPVTLVRTQTLLGIEWKVLGVPKLFSPCKYVPSEPTLSASCLSVVIRSVHTLICAALGSPRLTLLGNASYYEYCSQSLSLFSYLHMRVLGVHLILSSFLLRQYINPSPTIKCPFQRSTGYPRDLPCSARSCSTNTGSWWRWSHTAWLFCVWPEWPRCCSRTHWILFFLHRYFFREPKVLFKSAASVHLE